MTKGDQTNLFSLDTNDRFHFVGKKEVFQIIDLERSIEMRNLNEVTGASIKSDSDPFLKRIKKDDEVVYLRKA